MRNISRRRYCSGDESLVVEIGKFVVWWLRLEKRELKENIFSSLRNFIGNPKQKKISLEEIFFRKNSKDGEISHEIAPSFPVCLKDFNKGPKVI